MWVPAFMAALCPIASYARIKPVDADKDGGAVASQGIAGFDVAAGTIDVCSKGNAGGKTRVYDHFAAVIPPDATQAEAYRAIAQPLVEKWLAGYDADIILYGQTGSGKTYTAFGPPHAMARAATALGDGGRGTVSADGVMADVYGLFLRAGFQALAAVDAINRGGGGGGGGGPGGTSRAVLHGTMVEMSILSWQNQAVFDLLDKSKPAYVDKEHHLQGARYVPLRCTRDLVRMAAAVEARITRGTRMNDTSSRSHCMAAFTLHVLGGGGGGDAGGEEQVRGSRLQFFDMMGSERFKGANAAHDTGKSSKATLAGVEGIMANFSLLGLGEAVRAAADARRKRSKPLRGMTSVLTNMLKGSLEGHALTGMVTCLSAHARNGAESALSVAYSADMARLLNAPRPQPRRALAPLVARARKEHAKSAAIVERGVAGKYQARRTAEMAGWEATLNIFEELAGGAVGQAEGSGGAGGGGGRRRKGRKKKKKK